MYLNFRDKFWLLNYNITPLMSVTSWLPRKISTVTQDNMTKFRQRHPKQRVKSTGTCGSLVLTRRSANTQTWRRGMRHFEKNYITAGIL